MRRPLMPWALAAAFLAGGCALDAPLAQSRALPDTPPAVATAAATTPPPVVDATVPSATAPPAPAPDPAPAPTASAPDPAPTPTASAPDPEPTAHESEPQPEPEPPAATTLRRDDQGPEVLAVQRRLVALGYWLGQPDGDFGRLTEQAVLAFQGWEGLSRDGVVGPATETALASAGRPIPTSGLGDVLEVDEDRGVLLVVADGATTWAFHVSAGSYANYVGKDGVTRLADTPNGQWSITRVIDGLRHAPLGVLYRPRYFNGGIAFHGSSSVPAWGASHGCVRMTNAAMDFIWSQDLAPIGASVVVTGPTP